MSQLSIAKIREITLFDAEIDAEHEDLINKLETLAVAFERSESSRILELLHGFEMAARRHFQNEEVYMRKIRYPFHETHQWLHTTLLQALSDLVKRIEMRQERPNSATIKVLMLWVTSHLMTEDQKISDFIIDNQRKTQVGGAAS